MNQSRSSFFRNQIKNAHENIEKYRAIVVFYGSCANTLFQASCLYNGLGFSRDSHTVICYKQMQWACTVSTVLTLFMSLSPLQGGGILVYFSFLCQSAVTALSLSVSYVPVLLTYVYIINASLIWYWCLRKLSQLHQCFGGLSHIYFQGHGIKIL